MVGLNANVIESTAQLAPIYAGLVILLVVSALGIVCRTSLPRTLFSSLKGKRRKQQPRLPFGNGRPPAVGHFPSQA